MRKFGTITRVWTASAMLVSLASATTRTLPRAPGTTFLPTPAGGKDTFPVLDSAGNLTDLFGNELDGEYSDAPGPGFPGYGPITAAQSLAYSADLQEAGVPVTYTYISDLHEKKYYPSNYVTAGGVPSQSPACTTAGARTGYGLGPGDPCYEYNAAQWNAAFAVFFQRLADEGITPANTEFVFATDEGDHFNGADVGRAVQPACTGTPGVAVDTASSGQTPYECSYAAGTVGEVDTDIHGLLAAQQGDSTSSFYSQPQGEAVYVTSSATDTRQLEHEFASATIDDPFTGNPNTPITNYMVDQEEESILHISTADPSRKPSTSGTTGTTPPRSTPPGRAWSVRASPARASTASPRRTGRARPVRPPGWPNRCRRTCRARGSIRRTSGPP